MWVGVIGWCDDGPVGVEAVVGGVDVGGVSVHSLVEVRPLGVGQLAGLREGRYDGCVSWVSGDDRDPEPGRAPP